MIQVIFSLSVKNYFATVFLFKKIYMSLEPIKFDASSFVTEIVTLDYRTADVFLKYDIDFCCGGKLPLELACKARKLETETVLKELRHAVRKNSLSIAYEFDNWELDFLADYIVNTHHSYVVKTLPDIRAYAKKVMQVHGDHHPELLRIHQLVEEINADLMAHMVKEERVLFPYIKELVAAGKNTTPLHAAHFRSVAFFAAVSTR